MTTQIRYVVDRADACVLLAEAGIVPIQLTQKDFWSRDRFAKLQNPRFYLLRDPGVRVTGKLLIVHDTGVIFSYSRQRVTKINTRTKFKIPYLWSLDTNLNAEFTDLAVTQEDGHTAVKFFRLLTIGHIPE